MPSGTETILPLFPKHTAIKTTYTFCKQQQPLGNEVVMTFSRYATPSTITNAPADEQTRIVTNSVQFPLLSHQTGAIGQRIPLTSCRVAITTVPDRNLVFFLAAKHFSACQYCQPFVFSFSRDLNWSCPHRSLPANPRTIGTFTFEIEMHFLR